MESKLDTVNGTEYVTRDLYLSSALVTLKFPIIGINFQIEGERGMPVGYFSFEITTDLEDAIQRYWRGDLALEPKAYVTNMKSLKSQISNAAKNPFAQHRK